MRPNYGSSYKPRSVRRYEKKTKKNVVLSFIILGAFGLFFVVWGLPWLVGSLAFLTDFKKESGPTEVVEDTAIAPPILNIPYEATNTATIRIKGYAAADSEVEIYLDEEIKSKVHTNSDGSFMTDEIGLALGTNNIKGRTVNDEGKKSLPSKNIRLLYSSDKPNLQIATPNDGAEVKGGDKKIQIAGSTDPENHISVNGSTVIIRNDGTFSVEKPLNDGDNVFTIVATNVFGNSTQIQKTVKYTP